MSLPFMIMPEHPDVPPATGMAVSYDTGIAIGSVAPYTFIKKGVVHEVSFCKQEMVQG